MSEQPQLCLVEISRLRKPDGFWLEAAVKGGAGLQRLELVGPFRTRELCDWAERDLLAMMRSLGSIDVPGGRPQ
jgi:hypothetical protein